MASKRDNLAVVEDETPNQGADGAEGPRLVIALGRGKTGKSTFVRWAAERAIDRGGRPVIADGDRTNPTLSVHFSGVDRPPSAEDDDVKEWLNGLVDRQIEDRFSAFLDLGGGDLVLKTWARDLDLGPFLEGHGVTPVAVHFLSTDLDDLTYLRDIETEAKFRPASTAIVLNEGTVPAGRAAASAFEPVINHEVFRSVVARGARVVRMPRLGCMQEIDRRRLGFQDAEDGRVKAGQEKIGPVNRQLISLWRREMERSFATVAPWIT